MADMAIASHEKWVFGLFAERKFLSLDKGVRDKDFFVSMRDETC